jgi:hypothetical protein
MAKISETELQRRLKELRAKVNAPGPTAAKVGSTWEYTEPVLYLAYASALSGLSSAGTIANQSDATDFGMSPFNATGTLHQYRGYLFSKSMYASGDATDYIWEDVTAVSTTVIYTRQYSTDAKLQSYMGDPSNPGTGVTWTAIATGSAVPSSAFWAAEQYTFNGVTSSWVLFPVKSKEVGTPLASFSISGRSSLPALTSTQWASDTLLAMSAHTNESYSSVKEFGYGTAVVIDYPPTLGKQYGLYIKNAQACSVGAGTHLTESACTTAGGTWTEGNDGWIAPTSFVDGALLVDGTINADKIMANTITGGKINSATTITAGTGNNVGALSGITAYCTNAAHTTESTCIAAGARWADYRIYAGHADPTLAPFRVKQDGTVIIEKSTTTGKLVIEGDVIKVYTTSGGVDTLRVKLGNLA